MRMSGKIERLLERMVKRMVKRLLERLVERMRLWKKLKSQRSVLALRKRKHSWIE